MRTTKTGVALFLCMMAMGTLILMLSQDLGDLQTEYSYLKSEFEILKHDVKCSSQITDISKEYHAVVGNSWAQEAIQKLENDGFYITEVKSLSEPHGVCGYFNILIKYKG